MKSKLLACILMITFSFVSCSSKKNKREQEKVIVKIGNEELTLKMLKQEIPHQYKNFLTHEQIQNFIQQWIDHELIYHETIHLGMDKSEELTQALKKAKKEFLVDKLLDSLLTEDISVSDQEILDYYKKNKENFIRDKRKSNH